MGSGAPRPASSNNTDRPGSSLSRQATVTPADPAPTTTTSTLTPPPPHSSLLTTNLMESEALRRWSFRCDWRYDTTMRPGCVRDKGGSLWGTSTARSC